MDKMTRLAYASWLRCLHESRSHLMQASVLWETCMGQAALCEGSPDDPRHEAYEAMKTASFSTGMRFFLRFKPLKRQ